MGEFDDFIKAAQSLTKTSTDAEIRKVIALGERLQTKANREAQRKREEASLLEDMDNAIVDIIDGAEGLQTCLKEIRKRKIVLP